MEALVLVRFGRALADPIRCRILLALREAPAYPSDQTCSASAVAWQFSARDHAVREAREKTTLRIIAGAFLLLATYVTVDAARALADTGEASGPATIPRPKPSSTTVMVIARRVRSAWRLLIWSL